MTSASAGARNSGPPACRGRTPCHGHSATRAGSTASLRGGAAAPRGIPAAVPSSTGCSRFVLDWKSCFSTGLLAFAFQLDCKSYLYVREFFCFLINFIFSIS